MTVSYDLGFSSPLCKLCRWIILGSLPGLTFSGSMECRICLVFLFLVLLEILSTPEVKRNPHAVSVNVSVCCLQGMKSQPATQHWRWFSLKEWLWCQITCGLEHMGTDSPARALWGLSPMGLANKGDISWSLVGRHYVLPGGLVWWPLTRPLGSLSEKGLLLMGPFPRTGTGRCFWDRQPSPREPRVA